MNTPHLNASSRIMYQAAVARGISCTTFGDKQTILMEYQNQKWYTRGSRTSTQSSVGRTIADYKPLTKAIFEHYKLPTAKSVLIKKSADVNLLSKLQFPVVMKPVDGAHGRGVVVGIPDQAAAETKWQAVNEPTLFEEMLTGIEYRIVCVDFKFVAAAFRKPAHVIGDGQQTIEALIAEKNRHPWRGKGHEHNLTLIEVDELVRVYLTEQGFELSSVPPVGQEVMLRRTANLSTGGEAWDVTETVCPENQQLFAKIAEACDLNILGIDVMCQDLTQPIENQPQAGVIEINASPGLRMHHFPIQGQPREVANDILDMVMSQLGLTK